MIINIYCDESCHLEHDGEKAMVLGAVWCPQEKSREIAVRLREMKQRHGLDTAFEAKWTKVSAAKGDFYLDLVDYFFDNADLHFRALVIPDKSKLHHEFFPGQDHNVWYYKMYFDMLKIIFDPINRYRIYIDIKDTCGSLKVKKLHDVLCNNMYDFSREIVERVQLVRSHEVEAMQLTDVLIGAVSYLNRGLSRSAGKCAVVNRIRERSGYSLNKTTLFREEKFNIFIWRAREFSE